MALNSAVTDTKWSPNFSAGRPAGKPDKIVIHHWGNDGQSHQGVVDYLCRANGNSSAHYVASAGRVTQLVHDYDRAWHAGPSGNPRGIGIECRPEMSAGDIATVKSLIAAIRAEWGPLPIHAHRDYMSTTCPGRWYAILGQLGDGTAPATTAASSTSAKPSPTPATGITLDDLEEVITTMKATHIIFNGKGTDKNSVYIANILAGTYYHVPSPTALEQRITVLKRSGAKVAYWKDFSAAKPATNQADKIAFGTEVK